MPRKTDGSYLFRGSAYALAARFTKPVYSVIPTQAGVVLGACGGEAAASVHKFNYEGTIRFTAAASHVAGSEDADGRHDLATATIERLSFRDVVKADRIVARVRSEHAAFARREPYKMNEAAVTFDGSTFENLEIAGKRVEVKLSPIPSTHPTYHEYSHVQQKRGRYYSWSPDNVDGVIVTSLVEGDLKVQGEGITVEGHIITIRDFGKIHIAEVVMERGNRRLHMLRFELGSPVEGAAVVGGGEGNGTETWP